MNNAVELRKDNAPAEISDTNDAFMAMIARAAADPKTDVDKLERLMAMAERREAWNARVAYFAALSDMQDELPSIQERGEIKIGQGPGQKYALWEDINKAIKPILRGHGFALSFRTGIAETKITVTGVLSHAAGHSEETTIHLPSDTSGSKNAVQAVGSSTSYGKRYTAAALLNLTTGGEDDDAKGAGRGETLTDDEIQQVFDRLKLTKGDTAKFCTYMKVESVPDILRKNFGATLEAIESAAAARAKLASKP
jgi:hypothetical protein